MTTTVRTKTARRTTRTRPVIRRRHRSLLFPGSPPRRDPRQLLLPRRRRSRPNPSRKRRRRRRRRDRRRPRRRFPRTRRPRRLRRLLARLLLFRRSPRRFRLGAPSGTDPPTSQRRESTSRAAAALSRRRRFGAPSAPRWASTRQGIRFRRPTPPRTPPRTARAVSVRDAPRIRTSRRSSTSAAARRLARREAATVVRPTRSHDSFRRAL